MKTNLGDLELHDIPQDLLTVLEAIIPATPWAPGTPLEVHAYHEGARWVINLLKQTREHLEGGD